LASLILGHVLLQQGVLKQPDDTQQPQRIGFCPQFDVLWTDLTVLQHLTLFASVTGLSQYHAGLHARQIAGMVGLGSDEALGTLGKDLSGGMKRRLSLALSLMGEAQLVILDEPTTGVDPASRRKVWLLVHGVRQQLPNVTFMVTTHDTDEAAVLCDRVGILNHGRLCYLASSSQDEESFTMVEGTIPLQLDSGTHISLDKDKDNEIDHAKSNMLSFLHQSIKSFLTNDQPLESIFSCQIQHLRQPFCDSSRSLTAKVQVRLPPTLSPAIVLPSLVKSIEHYPGAQWRIGTPQLSDIFEDTIAQTL
jgi:ABC-type multidrug transport system ATPase subunit